MADGGGKSIYGGTFNDEKEGLMMSHYKRGILSMGNTGRDSNASQFFITLKDVEHLDGSHVVFGQLIKGMDVLRALEVGGSKCGKPTSEFRI